MFIKCLVLHLLFINGSYLEEEMATHCSIRAGKFHEKRSLAGYSLWSHKELDITKRAHTHTHSGSYYYKIITYSNSNLN